MNVSKENLKNWLPQVLIIIALNFIYFYPVLEGKILNQNDILTGQIKGKEIADYRAENGEEPLWRNHMFAGMPEMHKFPNSVFLYIQQAFTVFGSSSVYIIAIAMLGFFFWARSSGINPWLSMIAGIAVGFSAFFIISLGAGHNAKVRTAAYMAPILMGILFTYRGKLYAGLSITALFVGLSVFSNHIQITYYTFIVILILIAAQGFYAFKEQRFPAFVKRSILLLIAAMIGVGPNIGRLWTNVVNMKETMRGGGSELTLEENTNDKGLNYDYAMSWSYGIAETANLIFPYASGGGSHGDYSGTETYDRFYSSLKQQGYPTKKAEEIANQNAGSMLYWGDQSMVHGAYYMGAFVFFMFIFALLVLDKKRKVWVVAAIIVSLILAWGKNVEPISIWLFEYLPFYDKFRVPSMAFTIVFVLVPYLAFLGANELFQQNESQEFYKKKLIRALIICAVFCVGWWIIGISSFSFSGIQDERYSQYVDINVLLDDREALFQSSIFTSLVIMAVTFGLMYLYNQKTLKPAFFIAALGALVIFDLWSFDKEQVNKDSFITKRGFEQMAAMTPADQQILQDNDPHFRVWNTTMPITGDYKTAYYHKSLGGIHASKLQRYQDLIDYQISKGNQPTLDMLNTKYVIFENKQNGQQMAQRNPGALGNAWFVSEIIPATDANAEMELITDFDPSKQVVVHNEFKNYVSGLNLNPSGSEISLKSVDNKELVYNATVKSGEQFAVFSEIYYAPKNQAWEAYIDGEKAEYIRVNYILRGLKIPEGTHEIKFVFHPKTYYMGSAIDLAFSIILVLGLLFAGFKTWQEKKSETAK